MRKSLILTLILALVGLGGRWYHDHNRLTRVESQFNQKVDQQLEKDKYLIEQVQRDTTPVKVALAFMEHRHYISEEFSKATKERAAADAELIAKLLPEQPKLRHANRIIKIAVKP